MGGGGGAPYIQMIGMIIVFLGVVIGDLIYFKGLFKKNPLKDKTGICWGIRQIF